MDLPLSVQENYQLYQELPALGLFRQHLLVHRKNEFKKARLFTLDSNAARLSANERVGFLAAARDAMGLVHPGICRVLAYGEEGGVLWVLEEAGAERPVAEALRSASSPLVQLRMAQDILDALAYLHSRGVVHGSVIPGVLWYGSDGGKIGGLGSIAQGGRPDSTGALAAALPVVGSRDDIPKAVDEAAQDVHDLAGCLNRLVNWPEPVEQALHEAAGHDSGSKAAAVFAAAGEDWAATMGMTAIKKPPKPPRVEGSAAQQQGCLGLMLAVIGAFIRGVLTLGVTVAVLAAIALALFGYTLGQAPAVIVVPNLVGLDVEEATKRLEEDGLKIAVTHYRYDPDVEEGCVIETTPYAGKRVREGRTIRAVVSRGKKNIEVPKLVGLSLEGAREKLDEADLREGRLVRKADNRPEDTVVEQDPATGTLVYRKSRVHMVVSGGEDYGRLRGPDGKTYLFRTVRVTVPEGRPLQRVQVVVDGGSMKRDFVDKFCIPGEVLSVDIYGPPGATVRVLLEKEEVFKETLCPIGQYNKPSRKGF